MEVGGGFLTGGFGGGAPDDDLALEGEPWEEEGNRGIGGDFRGFGGVVIRKKGEARLIEGFQEDRALGGEAGGGNGGKGHGIRLVHGRFMRLVEPAFKHDDGIGEKIAPAESA